MGWFSIKKNDTNRNDLTIFAPITGTSIPLEDVPELIFNQRIVGDGLAIKPSNGQVMAPCDCVIKEIFKTKRALVLSSIPWNLTIFIHVGIETMEIGENNIFKPLVKEGEQVKKGTPILEFDINELQKKIHTLLTPVIISAESLSAVSDMEKVTGPCTANSTPCICINVHKDFKNKSKE